jgi:hypothetical protein
MPVSPELQRGITDLIYFTWLHNAEALAYFAGAMLMLYKQFVKPKRVYLLVFVGFVLLLLQFQYVKHIVEPLLDQTLQTVLQTGAAATRFQKITNFFLQKAVPIGLYVVGWGSIFAGLWFMDYKGKAKEKTHGTN